MRVISLVLAFVLTGCAATTARIPIAVPCVSDLPPTPASEFSALPPLDHNAPLGTALSQLDDAIRALLIDRERDRAHIGELRGILEGCR